MRKYAYIYRQGLEQNKLTGGHFPVWGTCLGFQAIVYAASNFKVKVKHPMTLNQMHRINFIQATFNQSKFSKYIPPRIAEYLQKDPTNYFNHHDGFTLKDFNADPLLSTQFNALAFYEKDKEQYVAIIEHKQYPIFGVQFHPEKILYEHKQRLRINLTLHSSIASQDMSRIIFAHSLQNRNRFRDQRVLNHFLFHNFSSLKTGGLFETVFLFSREYFRPRKFCFVPKGKVELLII